MQPQILDATDRRDSATRTVSLLALVAAGCVFVGWFTPYLSFAGGSSSLSDGDGSSQFAVLGPAVLGGVGALIGFGGNRRGAALGAGAASAVAGLCLVMVAVAYETVSGAGSFFDSGISYGIGFYLHAAAAAVSVAVIVMVLGLLRDRDEDDRTVPPALAGLGAAAIAARAIGMLLPDDGYSVFDIPSGAIKASYLAYTGVLALVGIAGFASQRRAGAALALGSASSPLLLWFVGAIESEQYGDGFFAGFNEGNMALVALGAIAATLFGLIGLSSGSSVVAPVLPDHHSTPVDGAFAAPVAPAMSVAPVGPTAAVAPTVPADGWYPDPIGRNQLRYWDGNRWTEHVANGTETATDPL